MRYSSVLDAIGDILKADGFAGVFVRVTLGAVAAVVLIVVAAVVASTRND